MRRTRVPHLGLVDLPQRQMQSDRGQMTKPPMVRLHIDSSDGRFHVRTVTNEEVAKGEAEGFDFAFLEESAWEAYRRHCDRDATWQVLWRSISNEQWMRRREKALMPLEDAEREIARLKDDLARAQRMTSYYEEERARVAAAVRSGHRREREYACVFPLPGCAVAILPPIWQESAREILAKYRPELAAEGMSVQGCCCGQHHQRLHDATVTQLRVNGFIVEHDLDYDEDDDEENV